MRHEQFETPGPVLVRVDNSSGEIHVTARPGVTTTEVTLIPLADGAADLVDRAQVTCIPLGDRYEVVVEIPKGITGGVNNLLRAVLGGSHGVRVDVTAPEGAALQAATASGDIETRGVLDNVRANTASGDVSVESAGTLRVATASGDVEVTTASGDVTVSTASGDVRLVQGQQAVGVNTASGDVSVSAALGPATIRTASGDVDVQDLHAGASLQTASGDLRVQRAIDGNIVVRSVSGDVSIGIASGTALRLDVQSVAGDLSSDIPLDNAAAEDASGRLIEISGNTVSGDVRITRAPAWD